MEMQCGQFLIIRETGMEICQTMLSFSKFVFVSFKITLRKACKWRPRSPVQILGLPLKHRWNTSSKGKTGPTMKRWEDRDGGGDSTAGGQEGERGCPRVAQCEALQPGQRARPRPRPGNAEIAQQFGCFVHETTLSEASIGNRKVFVPFVPVRACFFSLWTNDYQRYLNINEIYSWRADRRWLTEDIMTKNWLCRQNYLWSMWNYQKAWKFQISKL